jgi:cytochrome P450
MLEEWSKLVLSGEKEVDVRHEFRKLTADVIARTAFGSNYAEGKHIFNLQSQQMVLAAELLYSFYIPGFR